MPVEPRPAHERHKRIRFIKRLLRPLPRRANIHRYPVLKWFAQAARRRPFLWTFRVSAMTPAFYAGSIITFLPVPGLQFALAFLAALIFRANLPTLMGLQLVSNLATATVMVPATYFIGDFVIRWFDLELPDVRGAHLAVSLIVGGTICGLTMGCVLDLIYRFFAYEARKHRWRLPRRAREEAKESASPDDPGGHKPE